MFTQSNRQIGSLTHIHILTQTHIYTHTHTHQSTPPCVLTCVHMCLHVCMCVHMCACVCDRCMPRHTNTRKHTLGRTQTGCFLAHLRDARTLHHSSLLEGSAPVSLSLASSLALAGVSRMPTSSTHFAFTCFFSASTVASAVATAAVLGAVQLQGWGLTGVWWALVAMMVVRFVTLAWWYRTLGLLFGTK